ncbi:uncharacterized protein B0T15DRAFT_520289 [Chaetomium strumarium]|uniref:Uncharacterized protein n=1 Tax=Chaetomium strumarium TaxID=1170767 RepID=A0AAJ0H3B6_9PEZI|nr:hypothetical protein B0T15DRAFT_520289 [Chaetomium strumarium]
MILMFRFAMAVILRLHPALFIGRFLYPAYRSAPLIVFLCQIPSLIYAFSGLSGVKMQTPSDSSTFSSRSFLFHLGGSWNISRLNGMLST